MREGFVFYRSFYEAMKELPDKDFAIVFKALCGYALDDILPDLTGIHRALFELMKPQIDANNRRYDNGKKGGAPVGNSNAAKKEKQPKTTKNNQKQPKEKDKVKEKEKDKVKDNDNDKEKEYTPEGAIMIHDDIEHDLTFLRMVSEAKKRKGAL